MDFDNLFNTMPDAKRQDREYIAEGKHYLKVVNVESKQSQAGADLCILEFDVLASTGEHDAGDGVKQILGIGQGAELWRRKKNMGLIRSLIEAAMPETTLSPELLRSCLTGGEESALVGCTVKCVAKTKISKNQKAYLDFSYIAVSPEELETAVSAAATTAPSTTSATAPATTEEVPDFDF